MDFRLHPIRMQYMATNEPDVRRVSDAQSGESAEYLHLLRLKARTFGNLADHILHAPKPSIFDVSPLFPKLPDHSMTDFTLGDLELPGHVSLYLHFGCQDFLVIEDAKNRHFEGAYIHQKERVIDEVLKPFFA